jgi:hypothetical protein
MPAGTANWRRGLVRIGGVDQYRTFSGCDRRG